MKHSVYVGFDAREFTAFMVAVNSMIRHSAVHFPAPKALVLSSLQRSGLYTRPMHWENGSLIDEISEHPMSTEFAISRFFVPLLAKTGWALFTDGDVLALEDLAPIFDNADPKYAVMCVKHNHNPTNLKKMGGHAQSRYSRKNWSSVCLWNCDHPSNKKLTPAVLNAVAGRELHNFCWLNDNEIGELHLAYNFLAGHNKSHELNGDWLRLVHFTDGTPHMRGHEQGPYSSEWYHELELLLPNILRATGALPM